MKAFLTWALLLAAAASSPAAACLPPPPGMPEPPPPTMSDIARTVARGFPNIVYGVVTSDIGKDVRFKVIHVYKGNLRAGQVIRPQLGHTITRLPIMCPGMVSPIPVPRGSYGVIAYTDSPKLQFVEDEIVDAMIAERLIRSARTR